MTECKADGCEMEAVETLVLEHGTEWPVCVRHSQKSKTDLKEKTDGEGGS